MWLFFIYKSLNDDINHIIACISRERYFCLPTLRDFLWFSIRRMCNTFFFDICCVSFFISFDSPISVEMLPATMTTTTSSHAVWCFNWTFISCINFQRFLSRRGNQYARIKNVWKFNSFQLHFRLTSSSGTKIFAIENLNEYFLLSIASDWVSIILSTRENDAVGTWQHIYQLNELRIFTASTLLDVLLLIKWFSC